MPFEITQFDDEAVWYAPDVGDNRSQPEEDRFAVLIKPATAQQLRRIEEGHGNVTRGKVNFTRRYNTIRAEILTSCVLEIRNLTFRERRDGNVVEREITETKELIRVASDKLLEDITEAIRDQSLLEDGLLGKSGSPSDSST